MKLFRKKEQREPIGPAPDFFHNAQQVRAKFEEEENKNNFIQQTGNKFKDLLNHRSAAQLAEKALSDIKQALGYYSKEDESYQNHVDVHANWKKQGRGLFSSYNKMPDGIKEIHTIIFNYEDQDATDKVAQIDDIVQQHIASGETWRRQFTASAYEKIANILTEYRRQATPTNYESLLRRPRKASL